MDEPLNGYFTPNFTLDYNEEESHIVSIKIHQTEDEK